MFFVKAIRRLLQRISSRSSERDDRVKEGFINVYVGEEGEQLQKYTIPLKYLSSPAFQALLELSREKFGDRVCGPIKIPCEIKLFERSLKLVMAKENEGLCKKLSNDERFWRTARFVASADGDSPSKRSLLGGRMRYSRRSAGIY